MSDLEIQFLEITGASSSEIASYYLELSDGNINTAIDLYFDDNRPAKSTKSRTDGPSPAKLTKTVPVAKPGNEMLVLQWNIQGLLPTRLRERTVETAKEIERLQPDVLMLQEVIFETLYYFQSALSDYECFSPSDFPNSCGASYFSAVMVRKSTFRVESKTLVNFGSSNQGRDYIIVSGRCCEQPVTMMTSHLESLKPGASIRIQQLIKISEAMKKEPSPSTVMFGGDTNLRDHEVVEAKTKSDVFANEIDDVWEKLGSPADARFSWDCQRNDNQLKGTHVRLRFGRVYMRREKPESQSHFQPSSMKFVGTKRLPCGMFPSDHWGILVTMKLPEQLPKEEA